MAPKTTNPKDLITGGVLQCIEAATLGLPFEVWKTHMGGIPAFWSGWQPKMVESFLKGGVLLFAKEGIIRSASGAGLGEVSAGLLGGFGGGVAQVVVLGPCTFLVTAAVTGDKSTSLFEIAKRTYSTQGIKGFYHGGTALILRQGSNWASRQALTDILSITEEAIAGIVGGALSTWNQPFEVMRIDAQAQAVRGLPSRSFIQTFSHIVKENGFIGLFQGIIPRMGLCINQTLFLVTLPHVMKTYGFH